MSLTKNISFPCALLCLALSAPAFAARPSSGNFGVGLGGGTGTTGLSAKYYPSDSTAVQALVGIYGFGHSGGGMSLAADYLFEMPALAESEVVNVGWNVGPGAWGGVYSGGGLSGAFIGASAVAGLEFLVQPLPIDVVLEYRPALLLVPDIAIDFVSFDAHIRYYF